jgi:hypothetical protein
MSAIDLILRYGRQGVPPTFQRDFAGVKTLDHGTGPAITFTRASNATFFDANGALQTAANDTPRFDHDPATGASRGLLIEESRTNSIRNSQADGATVGVIGSGGVVPTNWIMSTPDGIAREVVATGTINGMNYVDLRWNGTRSGGSIGSIQLVPDALAQIVASSGQTWTGNMRIAVVAGSLVGTTNPILSIQERTSGGTFLLGTSTSYTASSNLNQITATRTLTDATTARVSTAFAATVANGSTVDITLRIAAPQLEQGAFPTSYIPTTTAAATRAADVATVSPVSSFYSPTESTMVAEFEVRGALPSARYVQFDDETNSNRIVLGLTSGGSVQNFTTVEGSTSLSSSIADTLVADTIYKIGAAFSANDAISARNGTVAGPDPTGSVPSGIVRLSLSGQPPTASTRQGLWLRKFAYWPRRLSNTLLEQLTT